MKAINDKESLIKIESDKLENDKLLWKQEYEKVKISQEGFTDLVSLSVRGATEGFTVPRKLLTQEEGSSLEAFFSGRHEVTKVDNHIYLDRDPEIFRLLLAYIGNDKTELKIGDPLTE
jgi:hypothetical protein